MASCPACGAIVPEDARACPGCGIALPDEAAEEPAGATMECPNCGATVPENADACPVCGRVQTPTNCEQHPDRPAVGVCVVCGRALCEACNNGEGKEYLCEVHRDVEIVDGWAEIYSTGDDVEANLIRDRLQGEGIDAQVLSQRDHYTIAVGMGDLAMVRVLVPAYEYEDAMRALAEQRESTGEVAPACPACGALYAQGDRTCAACGASLVESGEQP